MTPFALHRCALQVADELVLRPDVLAVALTGSLARGDPDRGSDVDLWVIGARDDREHFRRRGVPVTLLWQRPHTALSAETRLLYEVADAWVLFDPRGILARVRAEAWARRSQTRRRIRAGTTGFIRLLVREALRVAPTAPGLAVAHLREAGRRVAALHVYDTRGWRVPKWRHFQRGLPPRALRALAALQALPRGDRALASVLATLVETWPAAGPSTAARTWPPPVPHPADFRRMLRVGRTEDALMVLRASLSALPVGAAHVPAWRLWRAAQGFPSPAVAPARVRAAARGLLTLVGALGAEPRLKSGHVLADVRTLSR